jgi:hypothetical protein
MVNFKDFASEASQSWHWLYRVELACGFRSYDPKGLGSLRDLNATFVKDWYGACFFGIRFLQDECNYHF